MNVEEGNQQSTASNVERGDDHSDAKTSPRHLSYEHVRSGRDTGSPAPRIITVPAPTRPNSLKTLARDGSFMYKTIDKHSMLPMQPLPETKTPVNHLRNVRVSGSRSQTRSPPSTLANGIPGSDLASKPSGSQETADPTPRASPSPTDDYLQTAPSTLSRSRRAEDQGAQSTMRVRRIGVGSFLNGPVRRGMIRRQSEEDEIPSLDGVQDAHDSTPEVEVGRRGHEPELEDRPEDLLHYDHSLSYLSNKAVPDKPASLPDAAVTRLVQEEVRKSTIIAPLSHLESKPTPIGRANALPQKSTSSSQRLKYFVPSLPLLPSIHDQENEPPPTFRRNKQSPVHGEHPSSTERLMASKAPSSVQPSSASPARQPLAPRSQNTPLRPAPAPPPKMSMLEAATSIAGSARSKKSVHITINGKEYRRLDCIGRGGSSRVYRIMADNYKIFALKRVSLEDADMSAIAGYKGEIDLLRKLENVDRVIRLFDYEVKDDKGILNVMMELGESDFNKMLNEQLKSENARMDVTFTRHYWKEMLECVQAVHDHDIVHSDLKPANFLLVKGQLKLIDFGIANKIADDTVNVHRENQIGTPNYMSPESLVCHTPALGATNAGQKILKLGKPSDVWSLGCILYQMTYGQPPFARITKQFERIMSIPNPRVEIAFPNTGIGGAVVPFGLLKTLRRCLTREQSLRPTVKELLSESDPFLNPVAISADMLGRVIGNVVGYVRKREEQLKAEGRLGDPDVSCVPREEEMRGWPAAFYDKLRQAAVEGTAW